MNPVLSSLLYPYWKSFLQFEETEISLIIGINTYTS